MSFILIRIFSVILRLCRIAQIRGDRTDLFKPCALIIAVIISGQIPLQNLRCIFGGNVLRKLSFDDEIIVEEISDKLKDLFRIDEILSRFVSGTAQIENFFQLLFLLLKERKQYLTELSCPFFQESRKL